MEEALDLSFDRLLMMMMMVMMMMMMIYLNSDNEERYCNSTECFQKHHKEHVSRKSISDSVSENFRIQERHFEYLALMGHNAMYVRSRLPTLRYKLWIPYSRIKLLKINPLNLKMVPILRPEAPVSKFQPAL